MSSQIPELSLFPRLTGMTVGSHRSHTGVHHVTVPPVLDVLPNSSTQSRQSLQHPPGLPLLPSVSKQEQEEQKRATLNFAGNHPGSASDMNLARAMAMEQILSSSTLSLKAPAEFSLVPSTTKPTDGQVPAESTDNESPKPIVTSTGPLNSPFAPAQPSLSFAAQPPSNPIPEFSGLSLSSPTSMDKKPQPHLREATKLTEKPANPETDTLPSVSLLVTDKQAIKPIGRSPSAQVLPFTLNPELEILRTPTVSPSPQPSTTNLKASSSLPGVTDTLIGQNTISMLNEEAAARGLQMAFVELGQSGPSHHREFRMQVQIGSTVIEGRGVGKKAAKEDAARKALDELQLLKPLRSRQASDDTKTALTTNAVGSLQEYLAKQHLSLPEYRIESTSGKPHMPSFVMSVTVLGQTFSGQGKTKKEAKFNAAQTALATITGKNETNRHPTELQAVVQSNKPVLKTRRTVIKLDEDSQSRDENNSEAQVPLTKSVTVSPTIEQNPDDRIRDMLQKAYQTGRVRPINGSKALKHEETLKALADFLGYKLTSSPFQGTGTGMVAVIMSLIGKDGLPLAVVHSLKATEEAARHDAALQILLSLTSDKDEIQQQID